MPTIAKIGPYRIFFYANDRSEPVHIHMERENKVAKFWLDPVRLARSGGFSPKELARIQRRLRERQAPLIEAWNGYFRG